MLGGEFVNFILFIMLEYESIEADLWALGLIFLEAMNLQSNYEIYYLDEST